MLDLYLIRHGESEMNLHVAELVGGRTNETPLSKKGGVQPAFLGHRLQKDGVVFDEVYASPAVRAIQTAEIACRYLSFPSDRIVQLESLLELSQGDWEGKSRPETYSPEVIAAMDADPWNHKAPNGESQKEVEERMYAFVEEYLLPRWEKGLTVGVFTHGMAIKCLFRRLMGSEPSETWKIKIDNASMTRFKYDAKGWHLVCLNDAAHLRYLESNLRVD